MIDSEQKACLDAMGIPVWVRRDRDTARIPYAPADTVEQPVIRETPPAPAGPAANGGTARLRQAVDKGGSPMSAASAQKSKPVASTAATAVSAEVAQMDWQALETAVAGCHLCGLHETRNRVVFGTGDPRARWLFIGEAPGAEEDRQGEPFVGRAGQLLTAMIAALGMTREQVFIANVLKCRPPGNRDPHMDEVNACEPYLKRQISLIQPGIIVTLGRHAAHSLLRTDLPMAKLRGQSLEYQGIPLVATYHPAYLLRNPVDKRKVWADLCRARGLVEAS